MLRIENVSTGYGKKQVLFNISIKVKKGEIVLLAGSNGSGKSTLLKAIYGLLPQWNNGQIYFNNNNITGQISASLLEMGLLYIPQKNGFFEDLTVRENLEMAGLILGKRLLKCRIDKVLTNFNVLNEHMKRTPMKLSGGERQLLSLAMASLHEPKLILFDEPFSGLSPKNTTLLSEHIKLLNSYKKITLIIVEHRIKECIGFSDRVIGLKLGKVFFEQQVNSEFNLNSLKPIFI